MSSFLKIDSKDVVQSIAIAVAVAILGGLQQMLTAHGFDFASYDWGLILNLAVTTVLGALGVALGTTKEGKAFGVVKIK